LQVTDEHTGAAPSEIRDVSTSINRGQGPTGGCGTQSRSSCDDMGSVQVHFEPAFDSDGGDVGYRVELIAGTAPGYSLTESQGRVVLPAYRDETDGRAVLNFYWDDGDTDSQESLDFTITLTPVDAQGNEGPISDPIHIRDDGSGGCALGTQR